MTTDKIILKGKYMFQALFVFIVCALVLYGILKKVLPQGVLILAGAAFFAAAIMFTWGDASIPVKKATGSTFFDFFKYLKEIFSNRLGYLGLTILVVGGFAKYLEQVRASQKLVEYAVKPLGKIKEPYILLSLFFILGVFLNMFITSATGLGLLLMVTAYPILIGLGLSKYSVVGMIITTGTMEMGPVQANGIIASELANMDIGEYFIDYQLPVVIPTMIAMAITHYFWQKRGDRLIGHDVQKAKDELSKLSPEVNHQDDGDAPGYYALFPIIPFVVVLLFSKIAIKMGLDLGIKLDVVSAILFSVFIIMVFDFIKNKANIKIVLDNFNAFLKGMEPVLPVVTLIIAGTFFAKGLVAVGGVDMLIGLAESSGFGAVGMTIVMVCIIMLVAALMGSGVASFISLANITPPVAAKFGLSPVAMLLPMQLVSSLGRTFSPIAAVTIACSGLAGITTIDAVKRAYVPVTVGVITMLISSFML